MLQHGAAAVAVYHGDLLPGMLDDWVLAEREQRRRQCIELCDHLVAGWRDVGDPDKPLSTAGCGYASSLSRRSDTERSWSCRPTWATGRVP
jgi:hypothetical protein